MTVIKKKFHWSKHTEAKEAINVMIGEHVGTIISLEK